MIFHMCVHTQMLNINFMYSGHTYNTYLGLNVFHSFSTLKVCSQTAALYDRQTHGKAINSFRKDWVEVLSASGEENWGPHNAAAMTQHHTKESKGYRRYMLGFFKTRILLTLSSRSLTSYLCIILLFDLKTLESLSR